MIRTNGFRHLHPQQSPHESLSPAPTRESAPALWPPARTTTRSRETKPSKTVPTTRAATRLGRVPVLISAGWMAILAAMGISTAAAQDSVSIIRDGATGSKGGSGGVIGAGKTGGDGSPVLTSDFTYTFGPELSSTVPGTPAFYLRFTGGSGGDGGPSDCCNGGSGGGGSIPTLGNVEFNGTAIVTTSAAPGIGVDLQGGQGGRGGNSGFCCKGGDAGSGAGQAGLAYDLVFLNTDSNGNPTVAPWRINAAGDHSAALQIITRGGDGGQGGTGASAGSLGGQGGFARRINIGSTSWRPIQTQRQHLGQQFTGAGGSAVAQRR